MTSFVGKIKSFNPTKGWGFIECDDTFNMFGKDIFLMKTAVPPAGVQVGNFVSFTLVDGLKGQEASNVRVVGKGAQPLSGHKPAAINGSTSYTGAIKSYNAKTKYGFISCDETFAVYGKDIIVMSSSLPSGSAEVGSSVKFDIMEGEKGPQAINCQCGYRGVVKSFNEKKGWGMISCDETFALLGKDIFVMKTNLPNQWAQAGQPVQFEVIQGSKGAEAANVKNIGGAPQAAFWAQPAPFVPFSPPAQAFVKGGGKGNPMLAAMQASQDSRIFNMTHSGTIKSYNEEKGWGFVTAASQPLAAMHKDVFLMRSAVGENSIAAGQQVQFKVAMGQKGIQVQELLILPNVEHLFGQSLTGTVKSYNETKGWGFITGEQILEMFGRDVFFHKKDAGDSPPGVGTEVQFVVSSNNHGNPQAVELSSLGMSSPLVPRGKGNGARVMPY